MNRFLIILYVLATAGGLVLLKLGTSDNPLITIVSGKPILHITALTVMGIFLYGLSFLLYIMLISKFSLGYIVPLTTALVYILVFAASYFIFKEGFTSMKIVAIVMIIGGVILLNSAPDSVASDAKTVDSSTQTK